MQQQNSKDCEIRVESQCNPSNTRSPSYTSPRRSARLENQKFKGRDETCLTSTSNTATRPVSHQKRRRPLQDIQDEEEQPSKRARTFHKSADNRWSAPTGVLDTTTTLLRRAQKNERRPIEIWTETHKWPDDTEEQSYIMSEATSKKRSCSSHRSGYLEGLAEYGICFDEFTGVNSASREKCWEFLSGEYEPSAYQLHFPPEKIPVVLTRVSYFNESRIVSDISPWIVPRAENLQFCSQLPTNWLGDEINAEWNRCVIMGGTIPKPDYVAGLARNSFTKEELMILENYSSFQNPLFFTQNLYFPFLICEVKSGEEGLAKAERQNLHSASIAMNAIIRLYSMAFQDEPEKAPNLYGNVLLFTIAHNSTDVKIHGHCAILENQDQDVQFRRYTIKSINLLENNGREKFKPFNFVRNVYYSFAPEHLDRIKLAVARLSDSSKQTTRQNSQQNSFEHSQSNDICFKKPRRSASVSQLEQQRDDTERKLKQQKEDMEKEFQQRIEKQRLDMEDKIQEQIEAAIEKYVKQSGKKGRSR